MLMQNGITYMFLSSFELEDKIKKELNNHKPFYSLEELNNFLEMLIEQGLDYRKTLNLTWEKIVQEYCRF
jgi:hypothetical protein